MDVYVYWILLNFLTGMMIVAGLQSEKAVGSSSSSTSRKLALHPLKPGQ